MNKWMGRRRYQKVEEIIVRSKGWEFMEKHGPCDFNFLLNAAQANKFKCPDYEYKVLNDIRKHGIAMQHQVIYLNRYIADLALPASRTILELDGPYHEHKIQAERDEVRKELFNLFGFKYISWKMPMSEDEYQQKLGYFVKAHIKYAKDYPLRPINRPHAIEKATANGLVQKALELKGRKKR